MPTGAATCHAGPGKAASARQGLWVFTGLTGSVISGVYRPCRCASVAPNADRNLGWDRSLDLGLDLGLGLNLGLNLGLGPDQGLGAADGRAGARHGQASV